MKYLGLACIWVLCASPTLLHAGSVNGIEIVSQSYQISAQWTDGWYYWDLPNYGQPYPTGDWSDGSQVLPSGQITGGYHLSSSDGSPVAASTSAPTPLSPTSGLRGSASIDRFSFVNYATSPPGGAEKVSTPLGVAFENNGKILTSAQAIWDFRPEGSQLDVNILSSFGNQYGTTFSGLTILLRDMTSNATLLSAVNPDGYYWYIHGTGYTFAVDPDHLYEFSVSGWSDTYQWDFASESVTASFLAVPEPPDFIGGAQVLLPVGASALLSLRKRRTA